MPNQAESLDSLIEPEFSHYRIIKKLGGGGLGVVYEAEDSRLHRNVSKSREGTKAKSLRNNQAGEFQTNS